MSFGKGLELLLVISKSRSKFEGVRDLLSRVKFKLKNGVCCHGRKLGDFEEETKLPSETVS